MFVFYKCSKSSGYDQAGTPNFFFLSKAESRWTSDEGSPRPQHIRGIKLPYGKNLAMSRQTQKTRTNHKQDAKLSSQSQKARGTPRLKTRIFNVFYKTEISQEKNM